MIKIIKHKIKIYSYEYDVIITDSLEKAVTTISKKYKGTKELMQTIGEYNGLTIPFCEGHSIAVILIRDVPFHKIASTIAHEAYHITCNIFKYIGAAHEDECFAYLLDDIVENITKVYNDEIKKIQSGT